MTDISESTPSRPSKRTKKGTFKPGESGNPAGRPMGSKNKITLLRQEIELGLREFAAPRMLAVLEKAFELALAGDRPMIKLLVEQHMSKGSVEELGKAIERPQINITGVSKVEVSSVPPSSASTEVADETPSSSAADLLSP